MTEARTHVSNLNAAASAELKHWSTTNEAERNDRAATKVFCNRSLNMKRMRHVVRHGLHLGHVQAGGV